MHQDAKDILYTEDQIRADKKGESVVLVGVLKGAIVFFYRFSSFYR